MTSNKAKQHIEAFRDSVKDEAEEMHDYLKGVLASMDDTFCLAKYDLDQTNDTAHIYFNALPPFSKDYVKFYIYQLLHEGLSSPVTARSHFFHVQNFISFLVDEFYTTDILLIEEHEYKAYIDNLIKSVQDKDLEMKTAYSYMSSVRDFLNCLESNTFATYGYTTRYNISEKFPINKPTAYHTKEEAEKYKKEVRRKKEEKPIPYSDLAKILSFINQSRNIYTKTAIIIMSHTGLRIKELLNLEIDCIEKEFIDESMDFFGKRPEDNQIYWLSNYKVSKTKHKHWSDGTPILIPREVYDAIHELIEYTFEFRGQSEEKWNNLLFLTKKRGGSLHSFGVYTAAAIRNRMKEYATDIGVKAFTPHQFRYTFAKLLYDKQVPLDYIKKYLNHISEDMSAHYVSEDKSRNMSKYKEFIKMDIIEGHAKEDALNYRDRLTEASLNEDFQGMAVSQQEELFDMISADMGIGINIMDHGLCFLPSDTPCPNNFTEVNSCIDSHCSKFGITDKSIPFLKKMIDYKELSIVDLAKRGFHESATYNQKKLDKTIGIYNELKDEHNAKT